MPPALDSFHALTFDCYGTLIDWERGILAVLRPWAAREPLNATADQLLEAFAAAESAAEAATPSALYTDILTSAHRRLARALGVAPTDADAEALARSVGDWPAFPDTPDALRRLKRRFKLAVVSNVDHASFARTRPKLGVELDALVTAEDVGSYKPAHGHFLRAFEALGALGVERPRILHVAQSLWHDHAPAKALGMTTVWIDRRRGKPSPGATPAPPAGVSPDYIFRSMAEFADAVEQAFGAERGPVRQGA